MYMKVFSGNLKESNDTVVITSYRYSFFDDCRGNGMDSVTHFYVYSFIKKYIPSMIVGCLYRYQILFVHS